jgi:phage head maturation protease
MPDTTITNRLTRALDAQPRTLDAEARTVEVTFSTGAGVMRRDWEGTFLEVLSLQPGAVDLSRVPGMPVLNAHRATDLGSVLGVVRDANVDGKAGRATIAFSRRPDVEPLFRDVQDGILRNVSVGYSVDKWADSTDPQTGLRMRTAQAWTLLEISFVPVAADSGATVRSEEEFPMEPASAATPAAIPPVTRETVDAEIRRIGAVAGLDDAFASGLIISQATVEQARAAAFTAMEKRGGGPIRTATVEPGFSNDDPAVVIERMAEAIACRTGHGRPTDAAKPYMNRRLVDMAGELLTRRGERGVSMMSPDTILQRAAHTTSDFSTLLTATGNRVLLPAFEAAASPLKALARPTTIADFRSKTSIRLGEMEGGLVKVKETGEITSTTRSEAKEAYSLSTFARIFSLSRNAMINDDLGAFADWSAAMGRAAAETEARELVTLFTANSGLGPTMDDTHTLFHSTHSNVAGSGGAIAVGTLGAGRQAMRDQVGLAGEPINVVPKFLLVSSAKETLAEQVLATLYAATIADVNPFSGRLSLAVEPRLSGNPWYLFADPGQAPVLEYAYLTSAPGPQLAMREGWDVLGSEFRCVLDFGCGVVDYRGVYRNAGA